MTKLNATSNACPALLLGYIPMLSLLRQFLGMLLHRIIMAEGLLLTLLTR